MKELNLKRYHSEIGSNVEFWCAADDAMEPIFQHFSGGAIALPDKALEAFCVVAELHGYDVFKLSE